MVRQDPTAKHCQYYVSDEGVRSTNIRHVLVFIMHLAIIIYQNRAHSEVVQDGRMLFLLAIE